MRHLFGFTAILLSLTLHAQVETPFLSLCQLSVHADSYGRGIESAFTGEDLRIRYNDESCYQLGFEAAQEAIRVEGRVGCKEDFELGRPEGFAASAMSTGDQCYSLGHMAGKSALGAGAREGKKEVVGAKCVDAYKKGRSDGRSSQAPSSDTTFQPELFCYQLGHFEASMFE